MANKKAHLKIILVVWCGFFVCLLIWFFLFLLLIVLLFSFCCCLCVVLVFFFCNVEDIGLLTNQALYT